MKKTRRKTFENVTFFSFSNSNDANLKSKIEFVNNLLNKSKIFNAISTIYKIKFDDRQKFLLKKRFFFFIFLASRTRSSIKRSSRATGNLSNSIWKRISFSTSSITNEKKFLFNLKNSFFFRKNKIKFAFVFDFDFSFWNVFVSFFFFRIFEKKIEQLEHQLVDRTRHSDELQRRFDQMVRTKENENVFVFLQLSFFSSF